jgi:protein disulfide-isomerase A1
LAPKYEQLASVYADNSEYASKVTVAKIDATANDVPDAIQGFPTIKLYPAGSKGSPVEYSGSRTVEDLAAFIKANGKHQVDAVADLAKLNEEAAASSSASASASSAAEAAAASETAAPEATEEAAPEHDEL